MQYKINSLKNDYVLKASESELVDYYVDKASFDHLVLRTSEYFIADEKKSSIDVIHDFDRGGFPGERIYIDGTKQFRVSVPEHTVLSPNQQSRNTD